MGEIETDTEEDRVRVCAFVSYVSCVWSECKCVSVCVCDLRAEQVDWVTNAVEPFVK